MFVKILVGAFSKFHLAGRTIKGVPGRPEGRRHQPSTPGKDGLTELLRIKRASGLGRWINMAGRDARKISDCSTGLSTAVERDL